MKKNSPFKNLSDEIRRLASRKYFPMISENLKKKNSPYFKNLSEEICRLLPRQYFPIISEKTLSL